jgi:hypothetical protein
VCRHTFLLIEMGSHKFLARLSPNHNPSISASCVAGITGVITCIWTEGQGHGLREHTCCACVPGARCIAGDQDKLALSVGSAKAFSPVFCLKLWLLNPFGK